MPGAAVVGRIEDFIGQVMCELSGRRKKKRNASVSARCHISHLMLKLVEGLCRLALQDRCKACNRGI